MARCRFEQRDDAMTRNRGVDLIERPRNLIESVVDAGVHVRAGMQHHRVNAETLGAIELVDHRGDRFTMKLFIRRGEIDQIRRMRENRLHVAQ